MLNGSRIVKNTIFLYTRTFIMMLMGLYSSRIILDMLGASGYGTYQAVGGCIATLSTINVGISSAISRFIAYELGKKSQENLNKIFSTSINVLALICIAIALLAETVGLWFVHAHMQFPADSIDSVNFIFQLSLISYLIGVLSMPFMSVLIAYEEFNYIATLGIIQGVVQFILIIGISFLPSHQLNLYACSVFFSSVIYQFAYSYICIKKHPGIKYRFYIDKHQFKKLLSFASFSYIGSSAGILREQGVTVLINTFFGVVYNAARGVSVSVLSAVSSLVGSFTTAMSPQITKSYASGDYIYMWNLVGKGIRFSFFLLFILSAPVLASAEWILSLWLKIPPPMAALFTRLTIITALCDTLSAPLIYLMNATGKIALYQCVVGGTLLLTLPIDLVLLNIGCDAEILLWVNIVISFILFFIRLLMIRRLIDFKILDFVMSVLPRIFYVSITVAFMILTVHLCCSFLEASFFIEFCKLIFSFLFTGLSIYLIGITSEERYVFRNKVKRHLCFHR